MTLEAAHKLATTFAAIILGGGGLIAVITSAVVWVKDIEEKSITRCEVIAELDVLRKSIELTKLNTEYVRAETDIDNFQSLSKIVTGGVEMNLYEKAIAGKERDKSNLLNSISVQESEVEKAKKELDECDR